MSENVKQAWKRFYVLEEDFFKWLSDHSHLLYWKELNTIGYLTYKNQYGHTVTRPPKYIRQVRYVENFSSAQAQYQKVKSAYENAVILAHQEENPELPAENVDIRYPDRFPRFESNIEMVRVYVNRAVKSIRVDRDSVRQVVNLMTYNALDDVEYEQARADLKSMKEAGFKKVELVYVPKKFTYQLTIDRTELLDFFDTNRLQFRHETGSQYEARVLNQQGEAKKLSLGLILLDRFVQVEDALPRKTRSNKLNPDDAVNNQLPIYLPYLIFKK